MIYSTESKAFKAYLFIITPAAKQGDFETIAKLQVKAFEELARIGVETLVKVMKAKTIKGTHQCLMATCNKVLLGSLDISFSETMSSITNKADKDASPFCAYISMVVVKTEHRRNGVATKLLREAMAIAKNKGMRRAVLQVEERNTGAISCYNKEGFVMTEFKDGSYLVMVRGL